MFKKKYGSYILFVDESNVWKENPSKKLTKIVLDKEKFKIRNSFDNSNLNIPVGNRRVTTFD